MPSNDVSNLGRALTRLGLEDKFLSNGELSTFPLVDRGRIANGIIEEKLNLGRWQSVVSMMYGGFGKADALYEGDREELKESILKSARKYPSHSFEIEEAARTLSKAGEGDLLFKLTTSLPDLTYGKFSEMVSQIPSSYFNDPQFGPQRRQQIGQMAAEKAIHEGEYDSAFYALERIGDGEGIGKLFDLVLSESERHVSSEILERIALSDLERKDERLKKIVLSSLSGEKPIISPLKAFEFVKKYSIPLSADEMAKLDERAGTHADRYDFKKLSGNPNAELIWAKTHASQEPNLAYEIFSAQGYEGNEVILAVQSGLNMNYQNRERALNVSEVDEKHLKKAYPNAPFDVKVQIASQLEDENKLLALSREAHRKGDLSQAYHLWISGGGSHNIKYIEDIRAKLIAKSIEHNFGFVSFLEGSDLKGMADAYDALMESKKGERSNNVKSAYDIALRLGDQEGAQRAREAMLSINPRWAIDIFTSSSRDDKKGLDYALGFVASEHGVDKEQLKKFIDKYKPAHSF